MVRNRTWGGERERVRERSGAFCMMVMYVEEGKLVSSDETWLSVEAVCSLSDL